MSPEAPGEALLEVLDAFRSDLRGRPVLVFAADMGPGEASFVRRINEGVTSTRLPMVKALAATRDVTPEDLFRLDRHWRPGGHEAVAAALVPREQLRAAMAKERANQRAAVQQSEAAIQAVQAQFDAIETQLAAQS